MRTYLPRFRHRIVVPLGVAVAIGVPFTRLPTTLFWSTFVFVIALVVWTWFLRTTITASEIIGRDPETVRRVGISISEITEVVEGTFALGGVSGYVVHGKSTKAFIVDVAIKDHAFANWRPGLREFK